MGLLDDSVTRTCRYGHGPLTIIEQLDRSPVSWALPFSDDAIRDDWGYLHGLRLHLCGTCGYLELQDENPAKTIAHLRGQVDG